jgi:hypothetical protein
MSALTFNLKIALRRRGLIVGGFEARATSLRRRKFAKTIFSVGFAFRVITRNVFPIGFALRVATLFIFQISFASRVATLFIFPISFASVFKKTDAFPIYFLVFTILSLALSERFFQSRTAR